MPLIQISTSIELNKDQVNAIEHDLCVIVGSILSKPAEYVMVVIHQAYVEFGNAEDPAALVEVRSIGGLTRDNNAFLSQKISAVLERHLGIPAGRIYLLFADVAAVNWGWNGKTFG